MTKNAETDSLFEDIAESFQVKSPPKKINLGTLFDDGDVDEEYIPESNENEDSLGGTLSVFMGFEKSGYVPEQHWDPISKKIEPKRKKRKSLQTIRESSRCALMALVTDILNVCARRCHKKGADSSKPAKMAFDCTNINASNDKDREYDRLCQLLVSRCITEEETKMIKALIESGDPRPALEDVRRFVNFLLRPSDQLKEIPIKILDAVRDELENFRVDMKLPKSSEEMPVSSLSLCSSCGSTDLSREGDQSYCLSCGVMREPSMHDQDDTDQALLCDVDVYQKGRKFFNENGLFQHLAISDEGRLKIKVSALNVIREVCFKLGLGSEGDISEVALLLSRYAITPLVSRLRSVVAACCYLLKRKRGEEVTTSEVARRTGINMMTLMARISRMSVVLKIEKLPDATASCDIRQLCKKVYAWLENSESPESLEPEEFLFDYQDATNMIKADELEIWLQGSSDSQDKNLSKIEEYEKLDPDEFVAVPHIDSTSLDLLDGLLGPVKGNASVLHEDAAANDFFGLLDQGSKKKTKKRRRSLPELIILREAQKRKIEDLTEKLCDVYKLAKKFRSKCPGNGFGSLTHQRLEKRQVEYLSSPFLHYCASAIYFSAVHIKVPIPVQFIEDALGLKEGSCGHAKTWFIGVLRDYIDNCGLLDRSLLSYPINGIKKVGKRTWNTKWTELIINTVIANYDILIAADGKSF